MSQQSYMQNNIEQQKKMLGDYKVKLDKKTNSIHKLAIIAIIINVICLFAIPFASYRGETMSMFELFQDSDDDLMMVKLFYVVNWISTVVMIGITIKTFLGRESNKYGWVKPQLVASIINVFCMGMMLTTHMMAETDIFYLESLCFCWWLVPFAFAWIYVISPIFGIIYVKYIPMLENNVKEWEKKD